VPPTDLSAPHDASVVFLALCSAVLVFALVYVVRRALAGEPLGLWFLAGGLLAGVLEPMLDNLGLLWFASDNVAIAVETFHRHVPLYVVMGYAFYFGGLSYVAYRAMLAGKGRGWFLAFFASCWLADFALQATGGALGLYEYYGPQAWMVLDVPAWWFTIDAALPVLAGGVVFLLREQLTGWRALLIVPLVPGMYAGINAAAGWPIFSALNSGPSTIVVWAAGATAIALALLARAVMLSGVAQAQPRPGIARDVEISAPADVRAPVMRRVAGGHRPREAQP
jgi:hypothetical protein